MNKCDCGMQAGRQAGTISERLLYLENVSQRFCMIIFGAFRLQDLIVGCDRRLEDIFQCDTGHNALCFIGEISGSFTELFLLC